MDQEVETDGEVEEENKMWQIAIGTMDGEHEYETDIYFFGHYEDAERYANSYMSDYWGLGETEYDNIDDCWYNKGGELSAFIYGIYEYRTVVAMTVKGAMAYGLEFSLK